MADGDSFALGEYVGLAEGSFDTESEDGFFYGCRTAGYGTS